MNFLLAGEGSSDLGTLSSDGSLKKGAMTLLVDTIAEKNHDMTPDYRLVTESQVKALKKQDKRNIMGRGKEYKPFEEVYLSAQYLGKHAETVFQDAGAGVIFFKDSDGTNAVHRNLWETIVKAMQAGFEMSGNKNGVAMVPRPKSEAWLLGYYQKNLPGQNAYNHCERFEDLPGNDGSPNSTKELLKKALNTTGDVYDLIDKEKIEAIDWKQIDMPSLNLFRKRLENVLAAMTGSSYPHPITETQLA